MLREGRTGLRAGVGDLLDRSTSCRRPLRGSGARLSRRGWRTPSRARSRRTTPSTGSCTPCCAPSATDSTWTGRRATSRFWSCACTDFLSGWRRAHVRRGPREPRRTFLRRDGNRRLRALAGARRAGDPTCRRRTLAAAALILSGAGGARRTGGGADRTRVAAGAVRAISSTCSTDGSRAMRCGTSWPRA